MKRVVRNRSGIEIYGPKWQNTESSSSENENGDAVVHSVSVEIAQTTTAPPLPVIETNGLTPEGIGGRRIHLTNSHESMYRALLEGDRIAVELLLVRYPTLASDEISEKGDRALHVAAAFKHKEIVQKLIEEMSEEELAVLDGNGYTVCCYAAILGAVDIADLMLKKDQTLSTARDRENKTPLYKAAFSGNAKMVSYLLKYAKVEDLSMEEWFDLLLVIIRRGMYEVAFGICGSNEQLATLTRNDEGTALHLLAKQPLSVKRKQRRHMSLLAKKLWEGIQRLGDDKAVELMKNPSIIHIAAEVGNVELITMITHTYPHLVWHTDTQGYTMFHIAVMYRQWVLFRLIDETGANKYLIAVSQDENGNNILHLAGKVTPRVSMRRTLPIFQLYREAMWFEEVRSIVPPFCKEMRNEEGHTPKELFLKEHRSLVEKNATWTRNTADSWMLISTILFSVVFTSTFSVPGGYDQKTGIPILYKSNWFTCFAVFEALAMLSSALSVLHFSRTMMASDADFIYSLPYRIREGLLMLSLSVFSAVSVFMSTYFLVYVRERGALVKSVILFAYAVLVARVIGQNVGLRSSLAMCLLFPKRNRHSLFKRHADTRRRRCWVF